MAIRKFNFKLGADPEFTVRLFNSRLSARKLFIKLFKNGSREQIESGDSAGGYCIDSYGNIGWDSSDSTAEFRPTPSHSPARVTNNIAHLIKELAERGNMFIYETKSQGAPVGGHIHFEIPTNTKNEVLERVHKIMIAFYWPILLAEDKLSMYNRIKEGYARVGEWRSESYDTGRTYEFRLPSAEWITTPKTTKCVLSYLGVIFNEAMKNTDAIKKCDYFIHKNGRQAKALQELALTDFNLIIKSMLNYVRREIRKFELYEDFKEEIEWILKPQNMLKANIKADYNILYGWNLAKPEKKTKKKFMTKITIDEETNKELLPYIGVIKIGQGDDNLNVDEFVRNLKQQVLYNKFQLNNKYVLYGLRKEYKDFIITDSSNNLYHGKEHFIEQNDKVILERQTTYWTNQAHKLNRNLFNNSGNTIFVGIPYQIRINSKFKQFLELIYSFENGKFDKLDLTNSTLEENRMFAGKNTKKFGYYYSQDRIQNYTEKENIHQEHEQTLGSNTIGYSSSIEQFDN